MADESANSPTISLPKGGGALHGIGEKFSPDLHTGTGNFTVPLAVPQGRNGFQPEPILQYSTGQGNGPFGMGWSLSLPVIARKTSSGVPRYDDERDVFILAGSEDLVPVARPDATTTRYQPRTESQFSRITHRHDPTGAGDYWEVRNKSGLLSRFGTPRPSPLPANWTDPAVLRDPDPLGARRIFAWKPTQTRDAFGNLIRYEYDERDAGSAGSRLWEQPLLSAIRYADYGTAANPQFLVSVQLTYEVRSDPFSEYRSGFEIRTSKLCTKITIKTHGPEEHTVRHYSLSYLAAPHSGASLLAKIDVVGYDDAGQPDEELPPIELSYTQFQPEERDLVAISGPDLPPYSLANPDYALVDLFGTGLPDLLEMNKTVRYWRNLGRGKFDRPRVMREAPAGVSLADPGVQLIDANGDGRTDLLVTTATQSGYFPLTFGGTWDRRSFRPYRTAPSFSLQDPEVRLVDLNGDGITDAIRSGSRLECFFNHPHDGWESETRWAEREPLEQFPNVNFSDSRVRWADMSGDGLQDVVLLYDRNVEYWPNLGHGRWGARIHMENGPRLPYGYDPGRVLLGDVDGDGLADVVYVDDRRIHLWINKGGNGWSEEPIVIDGTPPVSNQVTVRLVDLLGTGVAGVLWSTDANGFGQPRTYFLDLTGSIKPYLLNRVDNRLGAVTAIEYAPSTTYYLADQRHYGTRWRTPLPFPVQVVSRVESADAISQGRLISEYRYHHGYWDGTEREFRGFAMVEQLDSETVTAAGARYSPPLLTRTWFHQGPVGDEAADWAELDLTDEWWSGDPARLGHVQGVNGFLASLPRRRMRRDALRSIRGSVLRTELYALDGSTREDRPYTVTERAYGIREESPPAAGDSARPRIFFPHLLAERTTEWERGSDPMTRFAYTGDYDGYGQPRSTISIAVPRGRDESATIPAASASPGPYLAIHTVTDYASRDDATHYLVDRSARRTTYEIPNDGRASLSQLRAAIESGTYDTAANLIAQSLMYYDGSAYTGLPFGTLGEYGALVRSESLMLTRAQLRGGYRSGSTLAVPPEEPVFLNPSGPVSWTADYPTEFRNRLPARAGYRYESGGPGSIHATGYYADTIRRRYDFQIRTNGRGRGLLTGVRDPLGRDVEIEYDAPYELLPVTTRQILDPASAAPNNALATVAELDYRTLQPRRVTDPNGNQTEVRYSSLGLLEEVWVRGKNDPPQPEGDRQTPSTRLEYDFSAFAERGEPISVRTIRRVHHDRETDVAEPERSETIESREYSDGFGRLVQTRTQSEELRFGDSTLGGGEALLPLEQADGPGTTVAGASVPAGMVNVTVSGWKVYDNKGRVVEKYEPFFSRGWAFGAPSAAELAACQKIVMQYDARGQLVRTINTDGTEQRMVHGVPGTIAAPDITTPDQYEPTPWEAYTYDANDNAGRTAAATAADYRHHWNTPSNVLIDALGHAILTVERTRARPANPTDPLPPVEEYRSIRRFDIRGNLLEVIDPLGRTAFRYSYDLANRVLRSESIDSGLKRSVLDAAGNVVEQRDGNGGLMLRAYDTLNRPTRLWARNRAGETVTLRERLVHGDSADSGLTRAQARAANLLGRVYRQYDEAGLVTFSAYDFKGNAVEDERQVIADSAIAAAISAQTGPVKSFVVNWNSPPGLEGSYRTSVAYDALNQVKSVMYPADANGVRRRLVPRYNPPGAIESLVFDGNTYVERVAYNAKGQRTLIAYGNGVMTRYAYDPTTFRLARLRTERYTKPGPATYQRTGTALQDSAYSYDAGGNLRVLTERTPGCGVRNNPEALLFPGLETAIGAGNALVRRFDYDPLYRLISATGREANSIPDPRPWTDEPVSGFDWNGVGSGSPANARDQTRIYTERYEYDPADNLLALRHDGRWTRWFGMSGFTANQWRTKVNDLRAGGNPTWGQEGNRLTHVTASGTDPATHSYDANGNLTAELASRRFAWDHAGRLVGFSEQPPGGGAGVEACYLYGADGMRVKKWMRRGPGTTPETSVYIGTLFERHRWREGGATRENSRLHIMDGRNRIAVVRIGATRTGDGGRPYQYHLGDHLGSSTLVVGGANPGASGFVNREEYFPYGDTSFGSFGRKRYRFTGQERDEESGLSYHSARYYAPWLCRWTSCDPAGPVDGNNLYVYTSNNPIRYLDSSGLQEEVEVGTEADRNLERVKRSLGVPPPSMGPLREWQEETEEDRWRKLEKEQKVKVQQETGETVTLTVMDNVDEAAARKRLRTVNNALKATEITAKGTLWLCWEALKAEVGARVLGFLGSKLGARLADDMAYMAERNIAAKAGAEAPAVTSKAAAEAFPVFELPVRIKGKTTGVLEIEGMAGNLKVVSGTKGPSKLLLEMEGMNSQAMEKVLTKRGFMPGNIVDVEVQAAVQMRLLGVKEATLRINHPKVCGRCMSNVAEILQEGQVLKVIDASRKTTTFIGKGTWH